MLKPKMKRKIKEDYSSYLKTWSHYKFWLKDYVIFYTGIGSKISTIGKIKGVNSDWYLIHDTNGSRWWVHQGNILKKLNIYKNPEYFI